MSVLEYILFANLYLVVFWGFYAFSLRKGKTFGLNRFYLVSGVLLAAILPLFHRWIPRGSNQSFIYITNGIGVPASVDLSAPVLPLEATALSWNLFLLLILVGGALITLFIHLYNHLKITRIMRRSLPGESHGSELRILVSDEGYGPFIYFGTVVLPCKLQDNELDLVLEHELLHFRFRHQADLSIFAVLHSLFWFNPAFVLMKRALRLTHEYQVDEAILSSGIDPSFYKLSLIRNCVGPARFAFVNALVNNNLKKRMIMMNISNKHKSFRTVLRYVPLVGLPLVLLNIAIINTGGTPPFESFGAEATLQEKVKQEKEKIEFREVPANKKVSKDGVIVVLINKDARILMDGKKVPMRDAGDILLKLYMLRLEENSSEEIMIVLQRDLKTDESEYKKLIDAIGTSLVKLREYQAMSVHGNSYQSLSETQKTSINEKIPLRIYIATPPKNIG